MPTKRRYEATQQTTMRDLVRIMKRIGASSLKIESEEDFLSTKGKNPAATIRFVRGNLMYRITQNRWQDNLDNLRSIQQRLYHLWKAVDPDDEFDMSEENAWRHNKAQIEAFNRMFEQTFVGYAATPDEMILMLGDGSQPWYEVLGVPQDALKSQIDNAFKAMARDLHPDLAADEQDRAERTTAMQRLNKARKDAYKARNLE